MKLSKIIKEFTQSDFKGKALDGANSRHKWNKYPKNKFEFYPNGSNKFPYQDDESEEELPESYGVQTVRHPSQAPPVHQFTRDISKSNSNQPGRGVSDRSFGRDLFATYDPSREGNKRRNQVQKGKLDSKVKSAGKMGRKSPIEEFAGPELKNRKERSNIDYTTDQPFKGGLKKTNDQRFHKFIDDEDDFLDKDPKDLNKLYMEWYDSDNYHNSRRSKSGKEDVDFWDNILKVQNFLMNSEEEIDERGKNDKKKRKKKSL